MKETIKINLAQRLFDLDADAYEKLKSYLESLKQFFSKNIDGADDLLQDIEQRIAELLHEALNDSKQVIILADIEKVIRQMGTAEDFARESEIEDESEQKSHKRSEEYQNRGQRKLFRDPDHNILGGVASGLAAYFNIDPIWMRLIFIALFFMNLFGLVLYAILWAIVPSAHTTSERLQMQGKPVNVENIQQTVKEEFGKVKDNINKFSKSESYRNLQNGLQGIFEMLGKIVLVSLKVLLIIIGVGFAIAGLSMIVGLISTLAAGTLWHGWHLPQLPFPDSIIPLFNNISLLSLTIFIVIIVPVISIVSAFVRLAFNLKKNNRLFSAFAWTIWSLALVFVLVTFISGHHRLGFEQKYTDEHIIDISNNQTLYISAQDKDQGTKQLNYYSILGKNIVREPWSNTVYLEPELTILPSFSNEVHMEIEYSTIIPWEHDQMPAPLKWSFHDSVLTIAKLWPADEDELWRMPKANILLYIPQEQTIQIDAALREIPLHISTINSRTNSLYNQKLIMHGEDLQIAEIE